MAELENIPTPMNLKWKRLRYQIVPIFVFVACATVTALLWKDHAAGAQAFGEVSSMTLQVNAPRDGRLMEQPNYPQPLDRVRAGDPIARFDSGSLVTQQEKVQEDLSKAQKELDEATRALEDAEKAGTAEKAALEDLRSRVATARAVVDERRWLFNDLDKQIRDCTIVAPAGGTVTMVLHQPNEYVRRGEELFKITQDTGAYIVSYVKPYGAIVPKKDQKVFLRGQSRKTATSIVQEVGTKLEPIPTQQLATISGKKPTSPGWGIPVRIAMPSPDLLPLKPGEMVSVHFKTDEP